MSHDFDFFCRNDLLTNPFAVLLSVFRGVGGAHGHLGLTLSPRRYALIINAPYNRPTHPEQLIIPAGTTQHMARTIQDQHTERLRLFREVTGVENALKQQIVAAVEPQYLEAIRNQVTGKLAG